MYKLMRYSCVEFSKQHNKSCLTRRVIRPSPAGGAPAVRTDLGAFNKARGGRGLLRRLSQLPAPQPF